MRLIYDGTLAEMNLATFKVFCVNPKSYLT